MFSCRGTVYCRTPQLFFKLLFNHNAHRRELLNSFVNSLNDSTKIEVTLKLNTIDLEAVIQTFLRYDYQIKASIKRIL